MKQEIEKPLDEQRRIVAYLDGLQAKVNALREVQSPSLHFEDCRSARKGVARRSQSHRDATQSALMPSILDKAFKGEL